MDKSIPIKEIGVRNKEKFIIIDLETKRCPRCHADFTKNGNSYNKNCYDNEWCFYCGLNYSAK